MRYHNIIITLIIVQSNLLLSAPTSPKLPIYIYKDIPNIKYQKYYSPSGWLGDIENIEMINNWKKNTYKGKSCLKFIYRIKHNKYFKWSGLIWQYPHSNWGNIDGSLNLSKAKKLIFWARGETGKEIISFKIGGRYGIYSDTTQIIKGPLKLEKKWKKYEINFKNEDMYSVSWGFSWIINDKFQSKDKIIFYIDEIIIK